MPYIYLFYIFLLSLLTYNHCLQMAEDQLALHCRDTDDEPVDWWYIYKPPSNVGPYLKSGINFSFITPKVARRWKRSKEHIFDQSMLRYTLSPMYIREYMDDEMALMVYEGQDPTAYFKGSSAYGIMFTNEMGGVWIGHTVPGFPADIDNGPTFPTEEIKNGHMIMCLSLDRSTLNSMSIAIKQSEAKIVKLTIPEKMGPLLPDWKRLLDPVDEPDEFIKSSKTSVKKTKVLNFVTQNKSLKGMIMARSPGDSRCLYKSFAKTRGIVMDVYRHMEHKYVICDRKYSVRNINAISLKFPDQQVYYIRNVSDSMGFAVSTAAEWQRAGRSHHKNQYWTCTGNIENQPFPAMGGIIACTNNYPVWITFDNLKIKEPDCV